MRTRIPSARVLRHALSDHHLRLLRDRDATPEQFRAALRRLSILLACEAGRDLPTEPAAVRTPLARAPGARLRGRLGLVPVLRAGLGMVEPILDLLPGAEVWHLGFYRDERTLRPVEYYRKFPPARPVDVAWVLDPMLATGGSAEAALKAVSDWGVSRVRLLSLIAAPEGLARVARAFPRIEVFVCAVDRRLDRRGYIVPGLGDAGDRLFNAATG